MTREDKPGTPHNERKAANTFRSFSIHSSQDPYGITVRGVTAG